MVGKIVIEEGLFIYNKDKNGFSNGTSGDGIPDTAELPAYE